MRTTTAGEDVILSATFYDVYHQIFVANADGTFIDLATLGSVEWVERITISHSIDKFAHEARVWIRRDSKIQVTAADPSFAPLDEDSPFNVDDLSAYAPLLDAGREIRIDIATTAKGVAPIGADYKRLFAGEIDHVGWGKTPLLVIARSLLASEASDRQIEDPTEYGSSAGIAVETVMQSVLDDWTSGPTLVTPSSPGFNIKPVVTLFGISVFDALTRLAGLIGYTVRERWRNATSDFRLVFEEPDRTPVAVDHTFATADYFAVQRASVDRDLIRNVVRVDYFDTSGVPQFVEVIDSGSITRYRRRFMAIAERADSPIDTSAEATALADAILADLQEPDFEHVVEARLFWPIQLNDYYRFPPNSIHYSTNQDLAVTGFRHELTRTRYRTFMQLRGKPAGLYRNWHRIPWYERIVTSETLDPPPQEALAGYWPMDEGSGTTLLDRSGQGRHAEAEVTSPAAVTWARGVSGYALDFPGADKGYELLTDAQMDAIQSEFYVCCWIKPSTVAGESSAVVFTRGPGLHFEVRLGQNEAFPQDIFLFYSDTDSVSLDDVIPSAGEWYFLLLQYDVANTLCEFWVGRQGSVLSRVLRDEGTDVFAADARALVLGSTVTVSGASTTNPFTGPIDEVRVGSGFLTHDQILALFRMPGHDSIGTIDRMPQIQADIEREDLSETATLTLEVLDPSEAITAVEFSKREGSQDGDVFGAFASTWNSDPGRPPWDGTYVETFSVPAGEESAIKYRVTWTDADGNSQVIGGTLYTAHVDEHSGEITLPIVGGQADLDTRTWNVGLGYAFPRLVSGDLVTTQAFPVPWGAEITAFRARLYRANAADACVCTLRRLSDTGVITSVATLSATAGGWSTQANTGLSDTVADPGLYQVHTIINPDNAGAPSDARGLYARVTYTRHNSQERY